MHMLHPPLELLLMEDHSSPVRVACTVWRNAKPRPEGALLNQEEVRHHFDEFIVFLKR